MNILGRTAGILAAVTLTLGNAVFALPGAAQQLAADTQPENTYLTEDGTEEEILYGDDGELAENTDDTPSEDGTGQEQTESVPGENVTPSGDEAEFAEEFAKKYQDPEYGKFLKAKEEAENQQEQTANISLPGDLVTIGEPGGGGSLSYLGSYNNYDLDHNSRFDDMDKVYGVDVSYFQNDINWTKVAKEVDFAIIRVGYRGYGKAGDLVLDYKFDENIEEAIDAGLEVGVYFYTQAITSEEAREEADFVTDHLDGYDIDLPVYFDIESVDYDEGRLDNAGLTVAQKTQICKAFCNRVIKNGYEAGVYANKNWLENMIDGDELGDKYPIWLAHYTDKTGYSGEYQTWQFSSTEKISGISTNVDMNVDYREVEQQAPVLSKPKNFRYSVSGGKATFTCDKIADANRYQFYSVDPVTGNKIKLDSGTEPTFTIDLTDTYTGYVIRGANTQGSSIVYSPFSDTLYAQKGMPANFRTEVTADGVKICWDAMEGATGYTLYRAVGAKGGFIKYMSLSADATSITERALKDFTSYGYRLLPYINGVKGTPTKDLWYITSVKTVSKPTVKSASSSSVTVSWQNVPDASGYEIAEYDYNNKYYAKKATAEKPGNVTISNLDPNSKHTYAVRAYITRGNTTKYGPYSALTSARTACAVPAKTYVKATSSGVKITWNAAKGAKNYRVYRKTTGGYKRIAEVRGTSYTDSKLPTGRVVYMVKALYVDGTKKYLSSESRHAAINATPSTPVIRSFSRTSSRIRINWNKVSNCGGYKIYMYDKAKKKYVTIKTIYTKKTTTCVATGLKSNTAYKFKVRPFKKGVNGICWGRCSKVISIATKW